MGSGAETAEETANYLNEQGEKVGVLNVRLYRPFSVEHFLKALPATVKTIAVLDRTKEPGAAGEPLYQDVVTAINEACASGTAPFKACPAVIGGRYGLSSKEFTPAMVKAVFDELKKDRPKNHFTVGINDDVTHTSLTYDPHFSIEADDTVRCVFFGLGADGTVGANKNSIKIIGEETDNYAQGYFVYDSKKSGSVTISHLRFGPKPIRAPYLIGNNDANFVACHQFSFLERFDMLKYAKPGGVFLLNSIYGPDEVWDHLPRKCRQTSSKRNSNSISSMLTKWPTRPAWAGASTPSCRPASLPSAAFCRATKPSHEIKKCIKKTYGKRGEAVVKQNFAAVDAHLGQPA